MGSYIESSLDAVHQFYLSIVTCFNCRRPGKFTVVHCVTDIWNSFLNDIISTSRKAQIPLRRLSPKLPVGKVVDTNHESCGHKPFRHVEMFATKSGTSSRQSRGLVADTNRESRRRDLYRGLS